MNSTQTTNVSDLFKAIADNEYFRVRHLLDAGVPVNSDDGNGVNWTPLHASAAMDRYEIAELLLERQANIEAVHCRGRSPGNTFTPLQIAAFHGRGAAASVLVQRGADVHASGDRGTALDIAADNGHDNVVAVLLDFWPASDKNRLTHLEKPLRLAVRGGHTNVVRLLVGRHAPAASRGVNGMTLLHEADNAEIASVLLDRCSADLDARDDGGNTPLHVAAYRGRSDVVKVLTSRKSSIEARNTAGETALHRAATQSVGSVVTTLLALGADPDSRTQSGKCPLELARAGGFTDAEAALVNRQRQQTQSSGEAPDAAQSSSRPKPWWQRW